MSKVPVEQLLIKPLEMVALFRQAKLSCTLDEARFEATLFNDLIKVEGGAHIKSMAYLKAKRHGTTLRLTRQNRITLFVQIEKYIEVKFNNYMIKEFGYC